MQPDRPPGSDPFGDLGQVRAALDLIGFQLATWVTRCEPDPEARQAASDAIAEIDIALARLHHIGAELVTQIRRSDAEAEDRADALLARTRDGPPDPSRTGDHRQTPRTSPRPNASSGIVGRGGDKGQDREVTP